MARHSLQVLSSLLASTARGWRGTQILHSATKPRRPLVLFDREDDADCRLVRELLTELDLDALIQPCPRGGKRFNRALRHAEQLPVLLDRDAKLRLSGLKPVAAHLLREYAQRGWLQPLATSLPMRLSSRLASVARFNAGRFARPSKAPKRPLELFSFESSPFSRLVRERLCELELPYLLRSFGKQQRSDWGPPNLRPTLKPYQPLPGSRRERMLKETGKVQVPYLLDPNTGHAQFESAQILDYLDRQYAVSG